MSFMAAAGTIGLTGLGATIGAGAMMGATVGGVGNLIQGKGLFDNLGQNLLVGGVGAGIMGGLGSLAGGSTIPEQKAAQLLAQEQSEMLKTAAQNMTFVPGQSQFVTPPAMSAVPTAPLDVSKFTQPSAIEPAKFMKNPADWLAQNPSTAAGMVTGFAGMLQTPTAAPVKPPGGNKYDYAYKPAQYGPDGRMVSAASYGTPTITSYAAGGSIPGFADGVYIPQSKSIRTDIYGSNAGPIGESGKQMYKNTDKYAGLKAQLDKMSPTMLSKLSQSGTDSIVQAAATTELYDRANAANSSYMDQPTMQAAQGGIMGMAGGGFLSQAIQAGLLGPTEAKAKQYSYDPNGQKYTELAQGGVASLPNEYAAGGKLLQGPGDGMSDSIPAVIKGARPQRAALAQGEFVIPADVVSHLGNGSTDAGAKRLYAMMDKIRHARTGTKKQGRQINPANFMPA